MTVPAGSRLLEAVAVMDRLRSPGGCPWDAEQTHASLAPYLLEEAYEALEALEDGDPVALREELGDVLLQVLFHARLAAEEADGWDIDDVAGDLVDKLVRRHPHVFAEVAVSGAADVEANWEQIKTAEKGRTSVTEGVPLGQPALSLAAKLQRRATRAGLPADLVVDGDGSPTAQVLRATVPLAAGSPDDATERVGALLFAAVALAAESGVDPEAALRGTSRRFRDRLAATERAVRDAGGDPADLDGTGWRDAWVADPA